VDRRPPARSLHLDLGAAARRPERGGARAARRETAVPVAPSPAAAAPTGPIAPEAPVAIPAGAIYACVAGSGEKHTITAIEFAPKLAALCARHPEMGPCQYEREGCRRHSGRVFAANGQEITRAVEADYDRKVTRIRMRADDAPLRSAPNLPHAA